MSTLRMAGNESMLAKAMEDLEKKWAITADGWRDQARTDFDEQHLEPMRHAVRTARSAIRNVDELMAKVVRDCS